MPSSGSSRNVRFRRRGEWATIAVIIALMAFGGFAIAQETGTTSEPQDAGEGHGPRWQREDAGDWEPGDKGPPPWSNARWQRDDADGWTPGSGPPPWTGRGDGNEADDTGLGPRWQRDDADGWTPGSGGPHPGPAKRTTTSR